MRCTYKLLLLAALIPSLCAAAQQAAPAAPEQPRPGPADVLELALEKQLYFVLPLALEQASGLKPEQTSYFEGMLAYHQARFDDAHKLLTSALNTPNSVLSSRQIIEALEALGVSARYTFHYAECAQMYQDIDTVFGPHLGPAEQGIKDSRHFCVAQMPIPLQTIDFTAPFTIRARNGEFPVSLNGKTIYAMLDTGAGQTILTESTAKAWGITPGDDTVEMHGYSGGTFHARAASIPQLTIGSATLHNVSVFIAPDADFYFAPLKHQVNVVVGYPVLAALGRLTFTRDGTLTASPVSPPGAADEGVPLWTGDTLLLVQLGTIPPSGQSFRFGGEHEPRLFVLDTGSLDTFLTDHYYMEHRDAFSGPPNATARLSGAGGEADVPAYSANHIPLWCGSAVFMLNGPHVLAVPQRNVTQNFEGVLGQSVLATAQSYTIDLRTMRFSMQPSL